jgi:hypothetical protein
MQEENVLRAIFFAGTVAHLTKRAHDTKRTHDAGAGLQSGAFSLAAAYVQRPRAQPVA